MTRPLSVCLSMLVAVLLSAGLLGTTATSASAKPPASSAQKLKYEKAANALTNAYRVEHSKKALKAQNCLKKQSRKWAKNMATKRKMYHQSLRPLLSKCKLKSVAENIAYGYPDGKSVVRAWMNSPGHRANILNGSYRLSYTGAYRASNGQWYASQLFGVAK